MYKLRNDLSTLVWKILANIQYHDVQLIYSRRWSLNEKMNPTQTSSYEWAVPWKNRLYDLCCCLIPTDGSADTCLSKPCFGLTSAIELHSVVGKVSYQRKDWLNRNFSEILGSYKRPIPLSMGLSTPQISCFVLISEGAGSKINQKWVEIRPQEGKNTPCLFLVRKWQIT